MGSVKDLRVLKPAFENSSGLGEFVFSDRYSVFDWGEMPDHIPHKGAALAVMAAYNFEGLAERSIRSHYKGLVVDGKVVRVSDLPEMSGGSNVMRVELAMVYKPIPRPFIFSNGRSNVVYDYSFFENNRGHLNNYLIPLEIIFRNGLPKGSSVFSRLKEAEGDQEAILNILASLGLSEVPKPGLMFKKPVISYTTKLEEGDSHLIPEEAYMISGLTREDFSDIEKLALEVDDFISEQVERAGIGPHWDGKIELRYHDGLELVDVLGTLDENRFGPELSKEFLRQWYHSNQPEFAVACSEFKRTGKGWQERSPVKPIPLPAELVSLTSQMYMSAANLYIGRRLFDSPELDIVVEKLKPYRS